jgi:hypothetical protein
MANKTVNLNKNASALMGENKKVRVRVQDGVLQILPTNRVCGKALPKGEILIDLRSKKQAVPALRFTLPGELAMAAMATGSFEFSLGKHGWVSLVGCEKAPLVPGKPAPAGGSITDK